jgi:dihydroorotate dehydrogenase electron transfer subunit
MAASIGSTGGEGTLMDEVMDSRVCTCGSAGAQGQKADGHLGEVPALEDAVLLSNVSLADDAWLMVLTAPRTASLARSGQFVHLRLPQERDSILRVPLSLFATSSEGTIALLYQVLGTSTRLMTQMRPGDVCDIIGPLGHGWLDPINMPEDDFAPRHALLVAGGLGAAPLATLAEELAAAACQVDVVMGARSSSRIVARDRLEAACCDLLIATDDGSEGYHGFVTQLVSEKFACHDAGNPYDYCAVCGPSPMEAAVARLVQGHGGLYAEVSMERLMACGVGACLSCVVPTTRGLVRSCFEGPVFSAAEVMWDEF